MKALRLRAYCAVVWLCALALLALNALAIWHSCRYEYEIVLYAQASEAAEFRLVGYLPDFGWDIRVQAGDEISLDSVRTEREEARTRVWIEGRALPGAGETGAEIYIRYRGPDSGDFVLTEEDEAARAFLAELPLSRETENAPVLLACGEGFALAADAYWAWDNAPNLRVWLLLATLLPLALLACFLCDRRRWFPGVAALVQPVMREVSAGASPERLAAAMRAARQYGMRVAGLQYISLALYSAMAGWALVLIGSRPLPFWLALVVCVLLVALLRRGLTRAESRLVQPCYRDCRPDDALLPLLALWSGGALRCCVLGRRHANASLRAIAAMLGLSGRFVCARSLLTAADAFLNPRDARRSPFYWNELAGLCWDLGDREGMALALEEMDKALHRLPPRRRRQAEILQAAYQAKRRRLSGEWQALAETLRADLARGQAGAKKASAYYRLWECARALGDEALEQECEEAVLSCGGELFYAGKIRENYEKN